MPPVPDAKAWAMDVLSLSWENLDLYAFPPIPLLINVVTKALGHQCQRMIIIAPGWPNMPWLWDLVELLSQIPICLPNRPDLLTQPFNGSLHRDPAIQEQGFSDQVATRIETPQRQSTRFVYETKWSIFVRWCKANQVDFHSPSVEQIADFLLHLFQDRKLQPSTIDGYRLAIADKIGNSSVSISKNENLNRLFDSFHRDRPKGR